MKRLYKFVSGVGKVELDSDEIKDMDSVTLPTESEPQSLAELSQKVDSILKALSALKILSLLKIDGDDGDGNS